MGKRERRVLHRVTAKLLLACGAMVGGWGILAPALVSAESDIAVLLGLLVTLSVLYVVTYLVVKAAADIDKLDEERTDEQG